MKRFCYMFVSAILFLLAVGAPTTLVRAGSETQDLVFNPAAEEYVRNELLADGEVDLATGFENAAERIVRGEFIVELWEDPAVQTIPFFKLYNGTILGDIKAEGITIPFNVELHNCAFDGGINLASTDVRTFRIDDSIVRGAVKLDRMVVNGDLALYNSTFEGGVTLFGADISNNLFARASKFLSTVPVPNSAFPFELWTTQVGQATEFTDAVFMGEVKSDDAKFGADLRFNNAVFEMPASFRNIQVGNIANFQNSQFKGWSDFDSSVFGLDARFPGVSFDGEATFTNIRVGNKADFQKVVFQDMVDFESSIMDRDVAFTEAVFHGDANFNYFSVIRFFDFDRTTLNQAFSFQYTTVGWPYFAGATFNGPVDFEGMEASNAFELTDASYTDLSEPFTVTLADVAGAVTFENFTAPAGLHLEHNHFGDLAITAPEGERFASINLSATKVNGDFEMENVATDVFQADGFVASDSTTFKQVSVAQALDMSNASVGFFTIDQFSWPRDVNAFNLRGMTYTDIGLYNRELNDDTWGVLLDMVEQSAYSPQAYRTLAQFLTEKGHPDWAADVELSRKARERDRILTPRSGAWFWSWFLYIFSGYGQRPDFAFIWSALVITIGAIVFRREQDMVILDTSDAKPPYNPILYSFALFLPYIDLGIASKWDPNPNRKFAGLYKHIHRLLGWVLMPIALLTFGGIIS